MRDNTIRGLRTFCAAARHLSFKDAADQLCITPSAVSHQIKLLEELIGAQLFDRRTREVALTRTGAELAEQVAPLLGQLDEVVSRVANSAGLRRPLRISLPPFFASEMFVPRLSEFADARDSLEIRVDTSDVGSGHHVASDASVVLLGEPPSGIVAHALFPLSLVPACSPELARKLDEDDASALLNATLIVNRSRPNAWSDWFAAAGLAPTETTNVLYLDTMFAVARAAERGLGVALVPVPLINSWFRSGSLRKISRRILQTPDCYYFVYRREDESNPDIRALRDWAIAAFSGIENGSTVD